MRTCNCSVDLSACHRNTRRRYICSRSDGPDYGEIHHLHCIHAFAGNCLVLIEKEIGEPGTCQASREPRQCRAVGVALGIGVGVEIHSTVVESRIDNAIKRAASVHRDGGNERVRRQGLFRFLGPVDTVTGDRVGTGGYNIIRGAGSSGSR